MSTIVTLEEDSFYHCGEFICGRYIRGVYGGERWDRGVREIKVDDKWITWSDGDIKLEQLKTKS